MHIRTCIYVSICTYIHRMHLLSRWIFLQTDFSYSCILVFNIIPFAAYKNPEFCLICFTYRLETRCSMEDEATRGEEQNRHIWGSVDFPYLLLHTGIRQDLARGGPGRCLHTVSLRGTRRPLAVSLWHTCCLRWVPTPQLTEHCNENWARVKRSVSRHIPCSNSDVSYGETGGVLCMGAPISKHFLGLNIF